LEAAGLESGIIDCVNEDIPKSGAEGKLLSTLVFTSFSAFVVVSIALLTPVSAAAFASPNLFDTLDAASPISVENVAYAKILAVRPANPIAVIGIPLYCRFNMDIMDS
jgi:hypothetical protein